MTTQREARNAMMEEYPNVREPIRDPRERLRALEAERERVSRLPYAREADEVINLVFDSGPSSNRRTEAVAKWITELIAAHGYGCSGYSLPPGAESPTIESPASGADEEPDVPASGPEDLNARLRRAKEDLGDFSGGDFRAIGPEPDYQPGDYEEMREGEPPPRYLP